MAVTAYQELSLDSCQMFPDLFRSHDGVARSPKLEKRNFARPHGAVSNEAPAVDGVGRPVADLVVVPSSPARGAVSWTW